MANATESADLQDPLAVAAALTGDFAASSDIEMTTRHVLAEIVQVLKAEAGALFLYDNKEENLVCRASVGPVSIEGRQVLRGQGIVGRSTLRNEVITTHNAYAEKDFHAGLDKATGFITDSLICAPLRVGAKTIGAVEVLNKTSGGPFGPQDEALIKVAAAAAGLAINNARITAQLLERESLKKEIELASRIQRSLLPKDIPDLPLRGLNQPARQISGDFYDYFALPNGKIAFALGDVSGKGMNAALLTAKTASIFRCIGKAMVDPGRLLTILNREIVETQTRGMFVTMIAGYFDPADGHLLLANAGHVPAMILRPNGKIEKYEADTVPLGILPDIRFPSRSLNITESQIFLFSDGLNEWQQDEKELGIEGVEKIFLKHHLKPIDQRLPAMMQEIGLDKRQASDDVTLLVLDASLVRSRKTRPANVSDVKTGQIVDLRLSADPSNLRLARGLLKATAQAQAFSKDEIEDILLAVTEALENVIVHAYQKREGEIILSLTRIKDGLKIHIRDFAPKVNLENIKPRDLEEIRPGGLGTHFIEQVMDKVEFLPLSEGEGNLLEMVKLRKKI